MADVVYIGDEGGVGRDAYKKIDAVFGFPTKELDENISHRLIAYLDYFSDKVAPGQWIEISSGYRSPGYNEGLRKSGRGAARTSTHMDGMAVDFSIDGVDGYQLWQLVRQSECCGVGHYGGNVVHLDVGRPRFWQQQTSKVDTDASAYNRYISLSTEFDRYFSGERVRLLLNSVSDFGFGVVEEIEILSLETGELVVETVKVNFREKGDCRLVTTRKESHFLYFSLPRHLSGKYQVRLKFCQKPFSEMPDSVVSRPFSISVFKTE